MELTESINSLNNQLINLFGIDTVTGKPIWRIVWSQDQFEKRLVDTTDEGLILMTPVVREVPKYRQWIIEKYVLERLVIVPEFSSKELSGLKQSYEPLWVFQDKNDNYLPPKIEVAKIVIDSVYAAQGKGNLAKYKEPGPEETIEMKKKEIDGIMNELYGDETDVSDHLARQSGVIVPPNYNNQN